MVRTLTRDEARRFLVGHAGLRAVTHPAGAEGVRSLLRARRCIQLDPLDRIGTNADLVALARLDGVRRGDVYRHLLPGHAFEHYAKERCLLPATAFPYYRDTMRGSAHAGIADRIRRLPGGLLDEVLDEVRARGPLTASQLDLGRVEPVDWSGWKGTARAASMALEILAHRCDVVVVGRTSRGKRFDVPERAFPEHHAAPSGDFARWALRERVEAAGLLPTAAGPWWKQIRDARTHVADELVEAGEIALVTVEGTRRTWLAPADARTFPEDDGRMRILGPLDPLLWDRKLVSHVFSFDYVWEVYKPAAQRQWGYYVCPLLHRGRLVGRFEAHREGDRIVVDRLWREEAFDEDAWTAALERLEAAQ